MENNSSNESSFQFPNEVITNNEELDQNKYSFGIYVAAAIVFVLVLIVFGVTGTYAYYTMGAVNNFKTMTSTVEADCFEVSLSSTDTYSLGVYNYPITDSFATTPGNLTPLTVTVHNSCTTGEKINYKLYLTTLPANDAIISDNAMKVYVKKDTEEVLKPQIIGLLKKVEATGENANIYSILQKAVQDNGNASDLINGNYYEVIPNSASGSVAANTTDTYSFTFWIDYNEGGSNNGDTQGKEFKVLVSAIIN